ncbi:hypothetical protein XELAEV_18036354mg [Xenopus laevis]|uniref:Uncharacterized protein n=1 Tax=Xenopus laevis TaxID=8355 RepID=A0A974CIN5_XENLA|nr:hypothetical protein XELAEV_18036354mg [Xenopus laevis]
MPFILLYRTFASNSLGTSLALALSPILSPMWMCRSLYRAKYLHELAQYILRRTCQIFIGQQSHGCGPPPPASLYMAPMIRLLAWGKWLD